MSDVVALNSRRSDTKLRIGFLRLTDSAPVIVAHEFGWFAEEGLDTELIAEPSWANIADKLAYGFLDAAIILPPLAFAVELGLRGASQPLLIPCNISLGGNTITLARGLSQPVRALAKARGITIVESLAAHLEQRGEPLPLGIVHTYSSHNLLLRYWLATAGLQAGREVRLSVVPPARAVEALKSGQIAGFCAGAPWGEIAARTGGGETVATSDDIWKSAPEKAFAVRARWAEENPESLKGVVRALARAGQFCDAPENASYTGALLSRHRYLDVDSHTVLSSLPGGAVASRNLSRFWRHAATFPWTSHGHWFLNQMARWDLVGDVDTAALVSRVYRPDIYRAAVIPLGVDVPISDSKAEGAHDQEWQLEALPHAIAMAADCFCDRKVFAPEKATAAF